LPPDLFSYTFDYSHVDGIGRARQRAIEPRLGGQTFRADAVGPIIEFGNLASIGDISILRSMNCFDDGSRRGLFDALIGGDDRWIQPDAKCGLISGHGLICDQKLNSFKIDAHKAALASNFGKTAALLIAAMGELVGNIIDHSQAKHTGLAVFLSREGVFEFVVADRGIGALASLKNCSDYAVLEDEGTALSEMIESGVSRFGRNVGHGNGFRPIFEKLADMTGQLRFRSGDAALTLDGRFGDKVSRQLSQKPRVSGFFSSVVCRTTNSS